MGSGRRLHLAFRIHLTSLASRLAQSVVIGALLVNLAACGDGNNEANGGAPPVTVPTAGPTGSANVGTAGGTVSGEEGAQVVFPKDALRADTTIRIAKDSTGAPPLPPTAIAAGAVWTITPHGGDFDELVEVSIPVEGADIAGDDQLLLVTAEPGDTEWRVLSGATYYDGKMRAPVSHFSFFQTIRLINQIMPSLVTKIDGANNIGGAGIGRISALANLPFLQYDAGYLPTNSIVAELSFPTLFTQTNTTTVRGAPAPTPSTTCRPIGLGHNAMSFRFSREGGQVFEPRIGHRAVVPNEPWPRFPGDGGPLQFTFETTIGRTGFPGFGAIHYYGNESPRISGFYDANPPTPAQIAAVAATQSRTYPPPDKLPIGNLYAMPTDADNAADNLYTWNGEVWWEPTQNGSVRIDAAIMTNCGLLLEAVPIAFHLTAPPTTRTYRHVVPDSASYYVEAAEQSEVSMYFGLRDSGQRDGWAYGDSDMTYRVDFSPDPATVAWQPVPLAAVTRETFYAANCYGCSQYSDAHGVKVSFPAVQASQAGFYRVFSCSTAGCFDGEAGHLVVLRAPPSISAQPVGQIVQVGETASFTVATAGAPIATLQWQKRSFGAAAFGFLAWTNIDGATSATYTTPALGMADTATQYRVWASNSLGGLSSDIVMLTVVDRFLPPTIDAQPGNLNVTVGGTAVFAATVSGTGPLGYQWRRNGTNITGANSSIFTLSNVSALNDGRYDLVVTNRGGTVTSEPAVLQVTLGTPVALAPTIASPPASITVAEGNAANFAVAVTGTGPYSYLWMKNGVQAPIPNGDLPSFSIASVTAADAGTYTVRVTNTAGTAVSAAATLTVGPGTGTSLAPAIITAPAALVVSPGRGATFAVAVTGTAPFSYQWRHDGVDVAGATGAVLHIAAVNALDGGQYAVEVRNAAGVATSAAVPLIVIGAPLITQQPAATTVTEGRAATLTVAANGDGLLYQWTRNEIVIAGATAPSYTTPLLALADSGATYGVIVYNGAGIVFSQGALLTVVAVPVMPKWQGALELTDPSPFTATNAVVAVDATGHFVAVWLDTDTAGTQILHASHYAPTEGWWSAIETVATVKSTGGATMSHAVAMDPSGNTVVIFTSLSNGRQSIWANRYEPGGAWGEPVLLENEDGGHAELPALAIDNQGTVTAIWQQNDTIFFPNMLSTRRIVASRFVPGQEWTEPVDIDFDTGAHGTGLGMHVAASPAGDVVAAWTTDTTIGQVAAANVLRRGAGWGGAQLLVTDTTPTTQSNVRGAAINDAGLALVTFRRLPSSTSNVFAARYTPSAGWASPELLGANGDAPTVVLGPDGTATVAWENASGTQILITRGSSANLWSAPQVAGNGFNPQLGRDADGNVTVAWLSNPGTRVVTSARWPAGDVLTAGEVIESAISATTGWSAGGLAVSDNGYSAAVWTESGASNAVPWANVSR